MGRKGAKMLIGYARTSTTDQQAGLAGQERDLRGAGAEKVFAEQVSSVANRSALKACLEFVREGDVLVVTKPDRLARSTAELLTVEADLSKRGIGLMVLSMGGERLDTPEPDIQADADHLGRCCDMGTRDHARTSAGRHCQGKGRGKIPWACANRRTPGRDDQDHACGWNIAGDDSP